MMRMSRYCHFLVLLWTDMALLAGCGAGPVDSSDTGGGESQSSCPPLTVVSCYSGPPGTEGVGACQAGKQICNALGEPDGEWIGQILPAPETCGSAMIDDDCGGEVDEGGVDCLVQWAITSPLWHRDAP